ncbi:MAG TPA: tetratricopeptide repeat protein [Candidatus Limnocylindrales bacterium]
MSFAAVLRAWRERALLSQEQLALRTGLGVRTIRRLEADGTRRPHGDTVRILADALELAEGERDHFAALARGDDAAPAAGVPRQLPRDATWFTGRSVELERVLAVASDLPRQPDGPKDSPGSAVVISAIDGMGGVGKTALAVHAGHRLAGQHPDGQLFIDLHGFTDGMAPVEPAQALDRLLRDIGVAGERIPARLEERAALWRSVLAGRRMLIVLDNAATEAQVQPLLPGAAGCLVLVTSRRRLTALDATTVVSLDTMPQADAIQLFARTADRPDLMTDAPEVREAVQLCGRLPLAIRIAAARLKHRRVWMVADLVTWLRDVIGRPATFHDGQRSLHGTLHLSYQHLSSDGQRMYRLLGLHPGPDIEPYAATALTGEGLDGVRRLLDRLADDHLLTEHTPGRYRFHDLVRAHAADTAVREETQAQQREAMNRLLDHYRHSTAAAVDAAYPFERQRLPTVSPSGSPVLDLSEPNRANRWLDTELGNLLAAAHRAAIHGFPEHTWQLSAILDGHLRTRSRHRDAEMLRQQALDLARDHGDLPAEMNALNDIAHGDSTLGRYRQATGHHERALQIAQEIGDRRGELDALAGLGHVHRLLGQYEQADDHYQRALQIAQEIGDRSGQRQTLQGLGSVHRMRGRYEEASGYYGEASRIAQDIGDRSGEWQALTGLGHVHRMLSQYEQAAGHYQRALQIAQKIGNRSGEWQALCGLGDIHQKLGRHREANSCYQKMLDLAKELGNSNGQFEALQGLGRLHHSTGQPDIALIHHQQALRVATDLAQPADQARAHDGLAHAHHALNQHELACQHWQRALDILTALGTDHTEEIGASIPEIRDHITAHHQA